MDKFAFNKLEIQKQIEYINNALAKGGSLRKISASLKMSKTTIRDRFSKIGFKFDPDKKQYIKNKDNTNIIQEQNNTHIPPVVKDKYKSNTNILPQEKKADMKPILSNEYNHNTNILSDKNVKEKIINMLSRYDDIKDMLDWYDSQKNIIEPMDLKIDINKLTGEVKTTTIRLYSDVWNNFKNFSNEFKEYKSMDLVSMALIEFMGKYGKQ